MTIILGDLHFGAKGFNENFLENQLKFFQEQLFPFMEEQDIDTIIQLGDVLDNRKSININFFDVLCKDFFDEIEKRGFRFITLLGNHDIYYRNTLDTNLMKYFEKLYPDNVKVAQKQEVLELEGLKARLVPWIVDENDVGLLDLENVDIVFGHFEIKQFEMVKGHVNTTSHLTSDFFKHFKRLKKVISGHYHIQSSDGFIHYVGTPFQLNWGDYKTQRGFFVLDGENLFFHENVVSPKFVKLKYNEKAKKLLELSGYADEDLYFDTVDELPGDLKNHYLKFFINEAETKEYETISFHLFEKGFNFEIVNNVEISKLIGTDYNTEVENIGGLELLMITVKEENPNLLPVIDELLSEINE